MPAGSFCHRLIHNRVAGNVPRKSLRRVPVIGTVLLGSLSPFAFVKLGEEEVDDGKTGEMHMLEASRQELKKEVPENVHGLRRVWSTIALAFDLYIFEPLATSFRFLHLVVIFVPVIFAAPVVLLGTKQQKRDNERSGALWWYGFLVRSMERAGPAFIKVYFLDCLASFYSSSEYSLANGLPRGKTYFLPRCAA